MIYKFLNIIVFSLLFSIISGCATDCYTYPTMRMCVPKDLDTVYPKQKQLDNEYYSKLKKLDRRDRRFSKIDKNLSIVWNKIIMDASKKLMDTNKILEEVSIENFKYQFDMTIYSENDIDLRPNIENIKYLARKQGVPETALEKMNFDKLKNRDISKFMMFFIEGKLYTKHLNDFYTKERKKVFITNKKVPFVKRTGNVFIPKNYIEKMSSDEIYMVLAHEANHLYDEKIIAWNAHISAFQNKIIKNFNNYDKKSFDKLKNILTLSYHNDITKEIAVDKNVLLMFDRDKKKRYLYQKMIEKVLTNKKSKEYKKRMNSIIRMNKLLDIYSGKLFLKTVLLNGLSVTPQTRPLLIKKPKVYIDRKVQKEYNDIFTMER